MCLCTCVLSRFSHVWLFVTLWTIACQVPLYTGFARQERWNGLPCPPARDLSDPGIEAVSPASPASAGKFFTAGPPGKPFSGSLSISDSQPCLPIRVTLEILLKINITTYYRDLDLITVSHWYFSTASHVILIYGQSWKLIYMIRVVDTMMCPHPKSLSKRGLSA